MEPGPSIDSRDSSVLCFPLQLLGSSSVGNALKFILQAGMVTVKVATALEGTYGLLGARHRPGHPVEKQLHVFDHFWQGNDQDDWALASREELSA